MTRAFIRTAVPLLAAMLVAGRAAAQQQIDPRLERLDAATRPAVVALLDSARSAVLPLARRARDADLVEFRRAVERDIALGALPAAATAAAASAAAQYLDMNAGAR